MKYGLETRRHVLQNEKHVMSIHKRTLTVATILYLVSDSHSKPQLSTFTGPYLGIAITLNHCHNFLAATLANRLNQPKNINIMI